MLKPNPYADRTDDNPVYEEINRDSRCLYVVFGGLSGGLAMPRFEFCQSLQIVEQSKIFVRDHAQCWYQVGLPGIADDVRGVADFLRGRIADLRPERTVFLGNSMGGFAAILIACLLGEGRAIAFAPQTFVSPTARLLYRDGRWRRSVWKMYARCLAKRCLFDLRPHVARAPNVDVDIYVSSDCRLDALHAGRLSHLANVSVRTFPSGGHGLVRHLRDEGRLGDVLRAA